MYKIVDKESLANLKGKTVRFTGTNKFEIDVDDGMMGILTGYQYNIYGDENPSEMVHVIFVDISKFEEHNDKYAESTYYDTNGTPCLTAKEAGYYSDVNDIYVGDEAPIEVVETDQCESNAS